MKTKAYFLSTAALALAAAVATSPAFAADATVTTGGSLQQGIETPANTGALPAATQPGAAATTQIGIQPAPEASATAPAAVNPQDSIRAAQERAAKIRELAIKNSASLNTTATVDARKTAQATVTTTTATDAAGISASEVAANAQVPATTATSVITPTFATDARMIDVTVPPGATDRKLLKSTVPVATGGVADTGLEWIKGIENNYTTKVVFSGEGGMFLADVNVNIADSKGVSVVNGTTSGPVLLADLPAGSYELEARYATHVKKQKFTVGAKKELKTHQIQFPVKEAEEAPTKMEGTTTVKP